MTRTNRIGSIGLVITGILLLAAAGALALTTGGSTGRTLTRTASAPRLPGPTQLPTGFTDDRFARGQVGVIDQAAELGAQWIRLMVTWQSIAPADPPPGFDAADPNAAGYDWTTLDGSLRTAAARHLDVLLTFQDAPSWAEGPDPPSSASAGSWQPEPQAVAAFAHALAERYSGTFPDPLRSGQTLPRVTHFQVWNEPNLAGYLSPQWSRGPRGSYLPASPGIYRRMLNAAYTAIKSAQPRATVLAAGTSPYGDPPGGTRMYPESFLRELLCLHGTGLTPEPCPDPAHLDALDHHPYSTTPTDGAAEPGDASIIDIGQLEHIVEVARRDHRVLPAGPKPYWITELDWPSTPPETLKADPYAVSLSVEAQYLSLAFYELWRQDVSHVLWFVVSDEPQLYGFGAGGVLFSDGRPKPAATAFRFPFVVTATSPGRATVWGRAPAAGKVSIQRQGPGGWTTVAELPTTGGGIFYGSARTTGATRLRAVLGRLSSFPYPTG